MNGHAVHDDSTSTYTPPTHTPHIHHRNWMPFRGRYSSSVLYFSCWAIGGVTRAFALEYFVESEWVYFSPCRLGMRYCILCERPGTFQEDASVAPTLDAPVAFIQSLWPPVEPEEGPA